MTVRQKGENMFRSFDRSIFDEPNSVDGPEFEKKRKVAPTFVIDLLISGVYVVAVLPSWRVAITHGLVVIIPSFAIGLAIIVCYFSKVFIVSYLDRRGGDARAYVKSSALVTDGPYRWSRHPTYAVAMLQFLLWSILAMYSTIICRLESFDVRGRFGFASRILYCQ